MIPLLVLAALIGLPMLLALLFRVSSILLFASLLAGSTFVHYLGDDISLATAAFIKSPDAGLFTQVVLLLLPVALTLVLARRSLSPGKFILNILPIISVGLATAVLVLPQFSSGLQGAIFATPYGNLLRQTQDDIIGIAVLLNLALIWISFRPHRSHHGKHHK